MVPSVVRTRLEKTPYDFELGGETADTCKRISFWTAGFVGAVAVVVLAGWMLDIEALKSVLPGFVTMKVNTAISLALLAAGIMTGRGLPARLLFAAVPALFGALTAVQYMFELDLGIDNFIIAEQPDAAETSNPGRMAPMTAFNFVLLSAALVVALMNVKQRIVEIFVGFPFIVSLTAFIGYIFSVKQFYGIAGYTKMALHTSVVFMLLCAAVVLARPDRPFCAVIVGSGSGSRTIRRLLIPFVVVLVSVSWLTVRGMKLNLYVPEFGTSLVIISAILILCVMFWMHARSLNRYEHAIRSHDREVTQAYESLRHSEEHVQTLNRELEKKLTELADAYKELETFSYSVSHDLRAPVRAIDGFSRILLEDYAKTLDDEGKRILGVIVANTKNMGQLIEDLLEFSRCGRQEMRMSMVDMNELVKDVSENVVGANVRVDLKKLPNATGDYAMVRQVVTNLVSNAVKFSSRNPSPSVEIGSMPDGPQVVYYVKDNGAGFDMKYSDKLFGVFQRLHTSAEFEGTGVGLAMVQRIIQRHGGRVWAEGKVDCGATFYFSLPYKGEAHGN